MRVSLSVTTVSAIHLRFRCNNQQISLFKIDFITSAVYFNCTRIQCQSKIIFIINSSLNNCKCSRKFYLLCTKSATQLHPNQCGKNARSLKRLSNQVYAFHFIRNDTSKHKRQKPFKQPASHQVQFTI